MNKFLHVFLSNDLFFNIISKKLIEVVITSSFLYNCIHEMNRLYELLRIIHLVLELPLINHLEDILDSLSDYLKMKIEG